jgi:hypothetical protein
MSFQSPMPKHALSTEHTSQHWKGFNCPTPGQQIESIARELTQQLIVTNTSRSSTPSELCFYFVHRMTLLLALLARTRNPISLNLESNLLTAASNCTHAACTMHAPAIQISMQQSRSCIRLQGIGWAMNPTTAEMHDLWRSGQTIQQQQLGAAQA